MGCQLKIRWEKFGLHHHSPHHFGTTQWDNKTASTAWYLVYRVIVFIYFYTFFFWNLFHDFGTGTRTIPLCYYLLYLTNWTYLTAIADILVQLITAILATVRAKQGKKPVVPVPLYKINWFIVNISHTMEPFVSILYWSSIFPQLPHGSSPPYSDLHLHLFTTIYTTIDLFIHKVPRRALHFIYPMIYGITYIVFTLIYYLAGGLDPFGNTGIYPILDWAKPGMTIGVVIGSIFVVLIMHAASWGIVMLRLHLHEKWFGHSITVNVDAERGGNGEASGGDVSVGGASSARGNENRPNNDDEFVDVELSIGDKSQSSTHSSTSNRQNMAQGETNHALEMDEAQDGKHVKSSSTASHQ